MEQDSAAIVAGTVSFPREGFQKARVLVMPQHVGVVDIGDRPTTR